MSEPIDRNTRLSPPNHPATKRSVTGWKHTLRRLPDNGFPALQNPQFRFATRSESDRELSGKEVGNGILRVIFMLDAVLKFHLV